MAMAGSGAVVVEVDDVSGADNVPGDERIADWVAQAVVAASEDNQRPREVSVRIVSADEIHTLNRDYRQRDKPTNVLSFPTGEIAGLPADESLMLGDIVVCAEVVAAEAREQGKGVQDHWAHMLVHGTLHLLGHDHMNAEEADRMESLEINVLSGFGVSNPYLSTN
jgi:probable rRNA maturation factor